MTSEGLGEMVEGDCRHVRRKIFAHVLFVELPLQIIINTGIFSTFLPTDLQAVNIMFLVVVVVVGGEN